MVFADRALLAGGGGAVGGLWAAAPDAAFLPALADVDWNVVVTAGVTAFVTVATTVGGGIAWLLNYISKAREAQRAHETGLATKFEALIGRVEVIQDKFQAALNDMARDNRAETRRMVQVVLDLQRETVTAMGAMGEKVSQLGATMTGLQDAIKEFRAELTDVHNRLPPATTPRA